MKRRQSKLQYLKTMRKLEKEEERAEVKKVENGGNEGGK